MAGLVPAIHVFLAGLSEDVDARDKPGHDEPRQKAPIIGCFFRSQTLGKAAVRGGTPAVFQHRVQQNAQHAGSFALGPINQYKPFAPGIGIVDGPFEYLTSAGVTFRCRPQRA